MLHFDKAVMCVEICNMLVLVVGTVYMLVGCVRAGYLSQGPSTSLELSNPSPGQYNYGYSSLYHQGQQGYSIKQYHYPQNQQANQYQEIQQAFQNPQSQQVYQFPQSQPVYQLPQSQQVYQLPQSQQVYQLPQSQQVYQLPQSQQVYQLPQSQQVYQHPQSHPVYQHPQSQQFYQYPQGKQMYLGNAVTYSVAPNDLEYLRQYKNGQYHYQTGAAPQTSHQSNNYQNENSNGGSSGYYDQGSSSYSSKSVSTQSVSQQSSGGAISDAYRPGYVSKSATTAPVVTKHIYFHVPPSEVENRQTQTISSTPPKKIYNIVFIKVPSQETKRGGSIQGLSVNQPTTVEDKTLIYVLVKKPDPQPLAQPLPLNSQHEVFYVKYKGDVNDVAGQINDQLEQQNSLQSSSVLQSNAQAGRETSQQLGARASAAQSSLQPGLVNGGL